MRILHHTSPGRVTSTSRVHYLISGHPVLWHSILVMSVGGVHLEASLPSPASWDGILQIPLTWNLWFHTSLGASCSQVSMWIPLYLLSVVVVYPYGLYAVSRCLFRPRHYYPGLVSLSCSCASTSTPGISVHHIWCLLLRVYWTTPHLYEDHHTSMTYLLHTSYTPTGPPTMCLTMYG
jgi:hypothetical protein